MPTILEEYIAKHPGSAQRYSGATIVVALVGSVIGINN